jgi:hypothetical protein
MAVARQTALALSCSFRAVILPYFAALVNYTRKGQWSVLYVLCVLYGRNLQLYQKNLLRWMQVVKLAYFSTTVNYTCQRFIVLTLLHFWGLYYKNIMDP